MYYKTLQKKKKKMQQVFSLLQIKMNKGTL